MFNENVKEKTVVSMKQVVKLSSLDMELNAMDDVKYHEFLAREFADVVNENWLSDKDLKKFFEDEKRRCDLLDAKALEKELRGDC